MLKFIFFLLVLGFIGGFFYVSSVEIDIAQSEVTKPVESSVFSAH